MMRSVPIQEEKGERFLFCLANKKVALCKPGRELSPDTGSDSTFILDFSGSRTMRNKCLSFGDSACSICYSSPKRLKHTDLGSNCEPAVQQLNDLKQAV